MRPDGPCFDGPGFGGLGFEGPASRWMDLFSRANFVSLGFDGPTSSVGLEGPEASSTTVRASSTRAFEGPAISSTGVLGSEAVSSPDLSVCACAFFESSYVRLANRNWPVLMYVPFPFSLLYIYVFIIFVPVMVSHIILLFISK